MKIIITSIFLILGAVTAITLTSVSAAPAAEGPALHHGVTMMAASQSAPAGSGISG